jgi:hypothetical protein
LIFSTCLLLLSGTRTCKLWFSDFKTYNSTHYPGTQVLDWDWTPHQFSSGKLHLINSPYKRNLKKLSSLLFQHWRL